jgi:hypothetical protein
MNQNCIALLQNLPRFCGECNSLFIRHHRKYRTLTNAGNLRYASTTITNGSNKFDFTSNGPCKVLEWAALPENRHVALKCLEVPSTNITTKNMKYTNWEDYWNDRGWEFPKQLKVDTEREYGKSLATHVMTAPMTILSMIDQLLTYSKSNVQRNNNNDRDVVTTTNVRWCCLGARSEASLPLKYWQEMIDLIHVHRLRNANTTTTNNLLHISLDFIGPEMNIKPDITIQQSSILLPDMNNHLDHSYTPSSTHCTIRWQYKGFYHTYYNEMLEHERTNECLYDAYILFNPGIGHSHLTKSWQPTLQVIHDQYHQTNHYVTMLFTAHSKIDAQRDYLVLQQLFSLSNQCFENTDNRTNITTNINDSIQSNEPFIYIENPFASRIYYHDPIIQEQQEGPHIVRPNHFVALFSKP